MNHILSTISHSTRKYIAAAILLFVISACTQTPAPNNAIARSTSIIGIPVENEDGSTGIATDTTQGLLGDYFDNTDFTGTQKTRIDGAINKIWNTNSPITGIANTTYSARWTGQILPEYTQKYTFFVTSSDGVRLMVNGQALVNDWVDGANRVRSGTVDLVANTKYDIRLEYYRNATNAGAVKLEWQSASRTKQVVPQARLYPTGSNATAVWNIIKTLNSIIVNNVSFDEKVANTYLATNNGIVFTAPLSSQPGRIFAILKNSQLLSGIIEFYRDDKLVVVDLRSGKSSDFGNIESYYDNNLDNNAVQQNLYKTKLVDSFTLQNSGGLRTQAVIGNLCPACSALYLVYLADYGVLATAISKFVAYYAVPLKFCIEATAFIPDLTLRPAAIKVCLGAAAGDLAVDFAYAGGNINNLLGELIGFAETATQSLLEWQSCIETASCQPKVSNPTPNPLKLEARVGETVSGQVSLRNIGFFSPSINISNSQAWLTIEQTGLNSIGQLPENQNLVVTIKAKCEQVGTFFGTVFVNATLPILDPEYQEQKTIDVELKCIAAPKLTANSLTMAALVNSSVDDKITVKNDGLADLNITQSTFVFTKSIAGALLSIPNFAGTTLVPGATKDFPIKGTCKTTAGILEGQLTLISNDPTSPKVVTVTLNCFGGNVVGIAGGRVDGPHREWIPATPIGKFSFKYNAVEGAINYVLQVEGATDGDFSIAIAGGAGGTLAAGATETVALTGICTFGGYPSSNTRDKYVAVKLVGGGVVARVLVKLNCYPKSVAASYSVGDQCGSGACFRGSATVKTTSPTGTALVHGTGLSTLIGQGVYLSKVVATKQATDFIASKLQVSVIPGYRGSSPSVLVETWEGYYARLKAVQGFN